MSKDLDWEYVDLGSCADLLSGYSFKSTEYAEDNDAIKLLRGDNIAQGWLRWENPKRWPSDKTEGLERYWLKVGDVVLAMDRPWIPAGMKCAAVAEADLPCLLLQRVARLRGENGLDTGFLKYVISGQEFTEYVLSVQTGTSVPHISGKQIKNFSFLLPPLAEQRRIAAVLSTIQEAIAAQDDVIAAAREFKRSLMQRLFTYGPAAEPAETQETEIGEIPKHWTVVDLGKALAHTQYGLNSRSELSGTYPVLRMNNLTGGKVDISNLKYAELEADELDKYRLNKNDVLFNRTNSYELVGKTALFDLEGDYTFASYLVRVVPDIDILFPEFLNYYLNDEGTQVRIKRLATRGVSQSNVSPTKLKRLIVGLPPLDEQQVISETLIKVDAKIAAEEDRKTALQALFKSMLHQLMTGQIRLLADIQVRHMCDPVS